MENNQPSQNIQPSQNQTPNQPAENKPQNSISFDLDERTKTTIIYSAIWAAVAAAIETFASQISYNFIGGAWGEFARAFGDLTNTIQIRFIINQAIWGAIYGAVGGFILSKFYLKIQEINQKYLKSKLDSMFKLLFYPTLVGAAIGFSLTSGFSSAFGFGIGPSVIIFAGIVLSRYLYAKMLTTKITSLYPSPVSGMPQAPEKPAPPQAPKI